MKLEVGMRVKLAKTLDVFNFGRFPAGAAGTVVDVAPVDGEERDIVAVVKMDDHFACLDEWDNVLQVFDEDGEVTDDAFVAA